jgi:hypothetical protein
MSSEYYDEYEVVENTNNNGNYLTKANNFLTNVNEFSNQLTIGVDHLSQIYQQSMQLKRDVAAINAWTDVELARIVAKYKSCEAFLNKTFGEREKTLNKLYNALDVAIESNNREAIIGAMKGMSEIVTSSPLSDLEKFAEIYNDTSQPLLDF